ncbi:MAG: hypothetical protein COA58_04315 [Bacteroidetes bacterium]|nr:MAG: hypothetical protein COA58_04315 [Bacteroidota bacterium]
MLDFTELLRTIADKLHYKTSSFLIIFFICMIPRVILQITNEGFNDDHITPVLLWQDKSEYPLTEDCKECFQPPLFYWIIKAVAAPFQATTWDGIFTVIQFVNFFFVSGILWLVLRLIESLHFSKWLRISTMLFWGTNPELISIGSLASNDTILIFAGLLISYLIGKYWQNPKLKYEFAIIIMLVLSGIIKGNGLVFVIILAVVFILSLLRDKKFSALKLGRQSMWLIVLLLGIGYFGNFFEKQERHGYAFTTNQIMPNPPNFFTEDTIYASRKGVTTVFNSFFKLRLGSLLANPYNTNHLEYDLHRTSLWGQMFGQFSNYLFERYPDSWISPNNDHYFITRINYIIHLPLFVLLLYGILYSIFVFFKHPFDTNTIHLLFVFAFTGFVVLYTYLYRDFSYMKVIFLFPALFSIITIFGSTIKRIPFQKGIIFLLFSATLLYQINFIYLIRVLIK